MTLPIRQAVLGPGESDPILPEKRFLPRSGPEARLPLNETAFRRAERAFKSRSPPPNLDTVIDAQLSDEALLSTFPHLSIDYLNPLEILSSHPIYASVIERFFTNTSCGCAFA